MKSLGLVEINNADGPEQKAGGLRLFAPGTFRDNPFTRSEAETIWNSRRRALTITVRWSVPAFLLQTPCETPSIRRSALRTTGHQRRSVSSSSKSENGA